MVIFVISAMFLAGCRANNVVENKDAPQDSKNNSETDATKEATTDLNQGLAPISTKTFDGIWKLTTYQNPDSVKKITEWIPAKPVFRNQLQVKWKIQVVHVDRKKLRNLLRRPYRSYPNGWGVYDIWLNHDFETLSGFINPDTGQVSKFDKSLGLTDGEYLYINDRQDVDLLCCYKLRDMSLLWEGNGIVGGICSTPLNISNGSLIYNDFCRDRYVLKRLDPKTGNTVWTLELIDLNQRDLEYGALLHESTSKCLIVEIDEINRHGNKDQTSDFKDYYKINSSDGSVTKVYIDPKYDVIDSVRCGEMILMKTLDKRFLIYNPENDEVVEHDIIKQTGYNVTKDTYMQIDYILENKLLISLSDSIESFQYFTYDFKSKKLTNISKENANLIQVVNGSLIVEYGNKSECIDPETQETLWTIEYQKEGSVQWLDWRGVLTFQDNQLVCYAPK